ncbi:ankyrin repeat-containing domain protein [Verticillium dahliae]|nr:ankyrin repeat-containing domain protein [Verticillium dahliae]
MAPTDSRELTSDCTAVQHGSLCRLPPELLNGIISRWGQNSTSALLRSCKQLLHAYTPLLYANNVQYSRASSTIWAARCQEDDVTISVLNKAVEAGAVLRKQHETSLEPFEHLRLPQMVYRDHFLSAQSQVRDMYPESAAISCLELLVEEGRDTVVLHLLQHGFHPHHMLTSRILNLVSGTHGSSPHLTDINPLHISAAMGLQKVAALLIDQHGTHVDSRDSCGYTPLSYAIRSPFADDEMLSELIRCGADLTQEVPHGGIQVSILEYACHTGRFTAALHILDALELSDVPGAYDPALRVTIPMPCFKTKGQTSHTKKILVSKLLGRGASPNAIVRSSGAPLLTHLVRNHPTAVDFLLALPGVLVDTPDESGHTALAYALSPRTQPSPVYLKVAVSLLAHKATLTTTMTKWILDGTRCISTMRHMKKTLERGLRLLDFFQIIYGHCIEVPQWQRTHAQQYFLAEAPEWTVHLTCRKKSKGLWTRRVVESKVNKYFDLKIVPRGSAMSLSAPVQYLEPSNDEAPTAGEGEAPTQLRIPESLHLSPGLPL